VKLEAPHLKLYKKLVKERLLEMEEKLIIADNAQSLRQQCLQIVTCPELFMDNINFKNNVVAACREIINGVDIKNTKVILFANYQNSVRVLAKHFEEYKPALMYGPSNSEKARKSFLTDDECRLLIAHPKSAGVGFNFQYVCHTVIFSEPTGVPGDFKQCMRRVDRSGQKNLVNVYIIKALDTISPKATREMLRKETEAQEVYHDRLTFLSDFKVA
jgi:SNF2 family DNA or RNA helicase